MYRRDKRRGGKKTKKTKKTNHTVSSKLIREIHMSSSAAA